jgi:pyrroline-5-carboxylate reductase
MSVEAQEIADRLEGVLERIAQAAARAGRDPEEIRLVGVTKGKSASLVAAGVRAGIRSIGENYVQECVPKLLEVLEILRGERLPAPRWHFIGRLQRNKARQVAQLFDVVETLDRPALGAALDRRAEQAGRRLEVLLQTNVSEEPQKGGVEPALLPDLLAASRAWPHLRVVGLMAVPAAADDPEASRAEFARHCASSPWGCPRTSRLRSKREPRSFASARRCSVRERIEGDRTRARRRPMSEPVAARIGFLGGGAMASALIGGLRAAGLEAAQLRAADPDPSRRKLLEEEHGIETWADNASLLSATDAVVVAVKPGVALPALEALRGAPEREGPLWISIAAGITLADIELALGAPVRAVRAMPNTPALVRAGATAICGNARATPADLALARALFESVGVCWTAPNESLLDAVTGLSGSGPAYVFVFLEALGDAGVRMGLPRDAAYQLAFQTVLGAARLAIEGGQHPAQLKDQVTSPGGTTIAGLERLEAGGLRAAVHEAVAAATQRSRELARNK